MARSSRRHVICSHGGSPRPRPGSSKVAHSVCPNRGIWPRLGPVSNGQLPAFNVPEQSSGSGISKEIRQLRFSHGVFPPPCGADRNGRVFMNVLTFSVSAVLAIIA